MFPLHGAWPSRRGKPYVMNIEYVNDVHVCETPNLCLLSYELSKQILLKYMQSFDLLNLGKKCLLL